jgi:hypothetical protein
MPDRTPSLYVLPTVLIFAAFLVAPAAVRPQEKEKEQVKGTLAKPGDALSPPGDGNLPFNAVE